MIPPVDPQTPDTLEHAVEALRRSGRPLTAGQILELIPPPSRVAVQHLEGLLTQDHRVSEWPPRAGAAQYWTRSPEDAADSGLMRLLAEAALGVSALLQKAGGDLPGYPGKSRPKLISNRLEALVKGGKLYRYPRGGKIRGVKFSARPAAAADYAGALAKELEALAKRLAPAGVTREAIVAALRRDVTDLPHRILEYLQTRPGGIGIGELRENVAPQLAEKARFDQAVLSLWRQNRVNLDRHDFPQGMSETDRDHYLVPDGRGNYYVMIGLREVDAQPLP
jgi:hypothetical protein